MDIQNQHNSNKGLSEEEISMNSQQTQLRLELVTLEQWHDTVLDILQQKKTYLKQAIPKNQQLAQRLEKRLQSIRETELKAKKVHSYMRNLEEELQHYEQQIQKCQEFLNAKKNERLVTNYFPGIQKTIARDSFGLKCRFLPDGKFKSRFVLQTTEESLSVSLFDTEYQADYSILSSEVAFGSSGSYYYTLTLHDLTPNPDLFIGVSNLKQNQNPIHIFLNVRKQRLELNAKTIKRFPFPVKEGVKMNIIIDMDYRTMVWFVDDLYEEDVSIKQFEPQDSIFFFLGIKNTTTRLVFNHTSQ